MLSEQQTAEFVRLLTATQADLYMFIRSLIFSNDDAADILGESNLAIWAQRDRFAIGTNFRAWTFQIVRLRVLQWRQRHQREMAVFSTPLFDELADYAESHAEPESHRLEDLRHCMKKLSPEDCALIERRYHAGSSAEKIAADIGRTAQWVYKAVYRIRAALTRCIARQMALRYKEALP